MFRPQARLFCPQAHLREDITDSQYIQPTAQITEERELRSNIRPPAFFVHRFGKNHDLMPSDGGQQNAALSASNTNEERFNNLLILQRPWDPIRLLPTELRMLIYDMLLYSEHTVHITPLRRHRTTLISLAQTSTFFRSEVACYIAQLEKKGKMDGLVNSPVFGWIYPERTTFIVPPRGWQYDPKSAEWTHRASTFRPTLMCGSPPKREERARVFMPCHPYHMLVAFEAWQEAMNYAGAFVDDMFNDILYYHPCFGYYRRMMGTLERLGW